MQKPPHKLRFAVLAADTVLFAVDQGKLHVLLIPVRRPLYFRDHWGVPGGLIHPKEVADQAARRHLKEKGGVSGMYIEQLYTFSRVNRDPRGRVVAVAYLALLPRIVRGARAKIEAQWYPIERLPRMAYDHKEMIQKAVRRLRAKLGYTNIAYALLPPVFTFSDLQKLYEGVLERKFDKRNFRKKFAVLKLLAPVPGKRQRGANRPAALYRFRARVPEIIEIL